MTKTPSKPSHPTSPGSGRRPWPARLFALGAVLLLVVSGLVVILSGLMRDGDGMDAAQRQSAYAADTLDRIAMLGSLDELGRARDLSGATDIGAQQVAALAREIAEAQAMLDRAIAQADNLPLLPDGYVPGADVSLDVPELTAGVYKLPEFVDGLQATAFDLTGVSGDGSPVGNRTGLHLPATGQPLVDDALSQLMGACAALRDLVAQHGVGSVPVPVPVPIGIPSDPCSIQGLDDLPVSDPTGVVGGLGDPTGGLLSSLGDGLIPPGIVPGDPTGMLGSVWPGSPSQQVQDANDAIDPDELGAVAAQLHAGTILGVTDRAYGQANRTLSDLLVAYGSLAGQLRILLEQAQEIADEAAEDLPEVLADRIAAIEREAEAMRADAEALAEAYIRTARSAADQSLSMVQDAAKTHIAKLQARLDGEVASLNARARQVVDLAESRKAAIDDLVHSAVDNLTRMAEESGVDATSQVAAIKAAGEAAVASLEAQAKAMVETLKQTAVLMQADAQAAVPRLTAMGSRAVSDLNGTLESALGEALAAKTYLRDYAVAWAAKAVAVETAAMEAAQELLATNLERYTDGLKETGLALVSTVPDVVGATAGLVGDAKELADLEVAKDVDYILKVASDYSKVPTAERKARALFWSTVGDLDRAALEQLGEAGDDLNALAELVLKAAEAAKAEVEAVVASA